MARKSMAEQLKRTANDQTQSNQERFAFADTVLLKDASKEKPKRIRKATPQKKETKLIRDGLLIPESDYLLIKEIMMVMAKRGVIVSKTEIYRAALHALSDMPKKEMAALFQKLEPVKRGRPKP